MPCGIPRPIPKTTLLFPQLCSAFPAWTSPPHPALVPLSSDPPNLLFKILSLESEQEAAHMVLP